MHKRKWTNGWVPFHCIPFPSACTCQQVKASEVTKSAKLDLTLLAQKLPLVAMVESSQSRNLLSITTQGQFGAMVYATSPDL